MPIEQLAKEVTLQETKDEMPKPMFEDSNRTTGMELPRNEDMEKTETPEGGIYRDSDRELSDGPQWNETGWDTSKLEPLDPDDQAGTKMETPDELTDLSGNKKDVKESEKSNDSKEQKDDSREKRGLTDEEKQEIKEKTGWSDEIIDSIGSMREAKIYMAAGLQEAEIAGKKCLIRSDIDMDQTDEDGITNRERMERGRPPLTKDGQEVELHHIGQKPDAPLAELTTQEHRGVGNDTILHDKNKESEIDRNEFEKERKDHWKDRAEEGDA